MKKRLNKEKYAGTIHKSGKFPREIRFDDLKEEDIPFLERIGLGHLVEEVKTGITLADSIADLEGYPRPDNPTKDAENERKRAEKAVENYMKPKKKRTRKKKDD